MGGTYPAPSVGRRESDGRTIMATGAFERLTVDVEALAMHGESQPDGYVAAGYYTDRNSGASGWLVAKAATKSASEVLTTLRSFSVSLARSRPRASR